MALVWLSPRFGFEMMRHISHGGSCSRTSAGVAGDRNFGFFYEGQNAR